MNRFPDAPPRPRSPQGRDSYRKTADWPLPHRRQVRKGLGDFCKQVVVNKAALYEFSGTAGGFLVPPELVLGINTVLSEEGFFHRYAYNQPMASATCAVPSVDLNASHTSGDSPLLGGISFTWKVDTDAGTNIIETEPAFTSAQLVAHSLTGYVVCSNQLIQDGGESLGRYLEYLFGRALEFFVERECFRGTGVGKPMGVVNSPATVAVNRAGSSHIVQADIASVAAALIPACYSRAMWACNPTTLADITKLTSYQLQGWSPGDGMGLCGHLFGRPLYVTEKLPVMGTKGDLLLMDPSMYCIGFRELEIEASPHPKFLTNQTVFRIVWRGDGLAIPKGTCTLADGATTAGCFVALN